MLQTSSDKKEKYFIIITGPTAVGKTSLAIKLAQHFSTEIISADSRQFYKEMNIGTAVPSDAELNAVKHHFIGNLSIQDYYNVYRFEHDALALIDTAFQSKDYMLMVGGSGLYINAVCNGIDEMPDADEQLREQLNRTFKVNGIEPLRDQLRLLDPDTYSTVDITNQKRIIRALEVCITTGKPYSSFMGNTHKRRPFRIIKIGLKREREELYEIINQRVDRMMEDGLESEARSLYAFRNQNSLNTVGYRELFHYFDGNGTLQEAVDKIKVNTRRYAKKQMTWFSRDTEISWFNPSEIDTIISFIRNQIS